MAETKLSKAAAADLIARRRVGTQRRNALLPSKPPAEESALADLIADAEAEFVWGTVWEGSRLDDPTRSAVALAISAAQSSGPAARRHAMVALRSGWSRNHIAEIVHHTACYAGFVAVEEVLSVIAEVFAEVDADPDSWPETARAPVVADPPEAPAPTGGPAVDRETGASGALSALGLEIRRQIFGTANIDAWMEKTTPNRFMMAFFDATHSYCFGTVWSRPGLDHRIRSILSLAINASQSQSGAVARHTRSAVVAGLTKLEIAEVLLLVYAYAGVYASLSSFIAANDEFTKMEAEGHFVPEDKASSSDP